MLIAVSADGNELNAAVSAKFEACRWLLFIETDDLAPQTKITSVEAVENKTPTDELAVAARIIGRDCEAVITGAFTPPVFNKLADVGITRYCGTGFSAQDAVIQMDANALPYIRYADENDTCHGEHSGGECNCGEDD